MSNENLNTLKKDLKNLTNKKIKLIREISELRQKEKWKVNELTQVSNKYMKLRNKI